MPPESKLKTFGGHLDERLLLYYYFLLVVDIDAFR